MSRLCVFAFVLCALVQSDVLTQRFVLTGRDFEATRAVLPGGEVEVTVAGGGELIPLSIRIGGRDRLRVSRAANVVWRLAEPARVRAMADGRAVAGFREYVGEYERALIADPSSVDCRSSGFLLAGALVASLAGDPSAGHRARDLIVRGHRLGIDTVPSEPDLCLREWRQSIVSADSARTSCLVVADGRDGWLERAAERTFCEADFVAAFTQGEVRLAACSGGSPPARPRRVVDF